VARALVRLAAALLALGLLVALDLGTKRWAASELRPRGPRTVAGGHFVLQYRENTGIAFGLLRDGGEAIQPALVAYSTVVALALAGLLVHRMARPGRAGVLVPAGLAAMLAGTLGNLYDRLERGHVIDFIATTRIAWPTFNVADVALAVGMALCLAGLAAAAVRAARAARAPGAAVG
jgi:signal peptidase II